MIFSKEIFEQAGLDQFSNLPATNVLCIASVCNGRINRTMYQIIIDYANRLHFYVNRIYVPATRFADHLTWEPVEYVGDAEKGKISLMNNIELVYNESYAPIEFVTEIEGEICNDIYVHALVLPEANVYKDCSLSYRDAKNRFPNELNWVHLQIG